MMSYDYNNILIKLSNSLISTYMNYMDTPRPFCQKTEQNISNIQNTNVFDLSLKIDQVNVSTENYFKTFEISYYKFHSLLHSISKNRKPSITCNYLRTVDEQYNIIRIGMQIHKYEPYNEMKIEHIYSALIYLYYALNLIEPEWDYLHVQHLRKIYPGIEYHIIKQLIFDIASKDVCIDEYELFSDIRKYLMGFKIFSHDCEINSDTD